MCNLIDRRVAIVGWLVCATSLSQGQLLISSYSTSGDLSVSGTLTNGICTLEQATKLDGPWLPLKNLFTSTTETNLVADQPTGFYRARTLDLTPANDGYNNLIQTYGLLTTIAGAGGTPTAGFNKWDPSYEGGPAVNAFLSRPHIAMGDTAGNIYIADKEAHAIRKVLLDGTIVTVAGINEPGDAPDSATPGTSAALSNPNGLWVRADGTLYILDLDNQKIRRLAMDGTLTTLFAVTGLTVGRGLWVSDDESLAYVCSGTIVKKWTPNQGVVDLASNFIELGNLAVDPQGQLHVTDRDAHLVYRINPNGSRSIVAGTGNTSGGGDGQLATETGLEEVRAIFFLPTGAYFLATHRGSQVWYVDTDGVIHLFINGHRSDTHAGDGSWFYNLSEFRVSENRQITVDHAGNLIICENDAGFIRKVEFLPVMED